jgi:hypothetical protein
LLLSVFEFVLQLSVPVQKRKSRPYKSAPQERKLFVCQRLNRVLARSDHPRIERT